MKRLRIWPSIIAGALLAAAPSLGLAPGEIASVGACAEARVLERKPPPGGDAASTSIGAARLRFSAQSVASAPPGASPIAAPAPVSFAGPGACDEPGSGCAGEPLVLDDPNPGSGCGIPGAPCK